MIGAVSDKTKKTEDLIDALMRPTPAVEELQRNAKQSSEQMTVMQETLKKSIATQEQFAQSQQQMMQSQQQIAQMLAMMLQGSGSHQQAQLSAPSAPPPLQQPQIPPPPPLQQDPLPPAPQQ
jgi:hypothetical protein